MTDVIIIDWLILQHRILTRIQQTASARILMIAEFVFESQNSTGGELMMPLPLPVRLYYVWLFFSCDFYA